MFNVNNFFNNNFKIMITLITQVKYVADHDTGFHAEVSYEGKAQYPPKSDKKPFVVETQKGYPEHEPAPLYGH